MVKPLMFYSDAMSSRTIDLNECIKCYTAVRPCSCSECVGCLQNSLVTTRTLQRQALIDDYLLGICPRTNYNSITIFCSQLNRMILYLTIDASNIVKVVCNTSRFIGIIITFYSIVCFLDEYFLSNVLLANMLSQSRLP